MDFLFVKYAAIIFASLVGVLLTIYIFGKKRRHEAMVCPLNGHCETVVNSQFSKFLGVPVELIGMFYYSMVALAYAVFLFLPMLATPLLTIGIFAATMLAFLFSAYLIFIQVFYIKQYCTWCLGSAGLSTIIFAVSLLVSGGAAVLLITPYMGVVASVYSLALALGIGSATFAAIFLGKFLKDLYVSHLEAQLMKLVSQITWLSLGVLFVTGVGLYVVPVARGATFSLSPLTVSMLLILICGGALLDLLVTPRLITISSGKDHMHQMGELRLLRRAALAISSITLVSWYSLFALSTMPISSSRATLMAYGALLIIGLFISGIVEQRLAKKVF